MINSMLQSVLDDNDDSKAPPLDMKQLLHYHMDRDKKDKFDNRREGMMKRLAPAGNIYRLNAYNREKLKHTHDLHLQLHELASEHEALLTTLGLASDSGPTVSSDAHLKTQLCELLRDAPVQGNGEATSSTYPPISDFLKGTAPHRCCITGILIANHKMRRAELGALLIAAIQLLGPIWLIAEGWRNKSNHFLTIDWNEFVNDYAQNGDECKWFYISREMLIATFFLLVIGEAVCFYAKVELRGRAGSTLVPMDCFWMLFGDAVNQCCLVTSFISMPFVFWNESTMKDVIWNSLGILFIFHLDDFSSGISDHLQMDDDTFAHMTARMVALLGHCPVSLKDVFNPQAQSQEELWQLKVGEKGLLKVGSDDYCETRLSKVIGDKMNDEWDYKITPRGTEVRIPSPSAWMGTTAWLIVYILLMCLQVLTPIAFYVASKPCLAASTGSSFVALQQQKSHKSMVNATVTSGVRQAGRTARAMAGITTHGQRTSQPRKRLSKAALAHHADGHLSLVADPVVADPVA